MDIPSAEGKNCKEMSLELSQKDRVRWFRKEGVNYVEIQNRK